MNRCDDLERCTAYLLMGGRFLGSGFAVAPGWWVTAAHVVGSVEDARLRLSWDAEGPGHPVDSVVCYPPEPGGEHMYAFPDVGVLRVGTSADDRPFLALAADDPPAGMWLRAVGWSLSTPVKRVAHDALRFAVVGRSAGFLRVQSDEIKPGLSGSPVVDDDGNVRGIVKGSRDYQDVRGGWITPVSALRAILPADVPLVRTRCREPLSAAALVAALVEVPGIDDPSFRRMLLTQVGSVLGSGVAAQVPFSYVAVEHLTAMAEAYRQAPDPEAFLVALCDVLDLLRGGTRAVVGLRRLAGRAGDHR